MTCILPDTLARIAIEGGLDTFRPIRTKDKDILMITQETMSEGIIDEME